MKSRLNERLICVSYWLKLVILRLTDNLYTVERKKRYTVKSERYKGNVYYLHVDNIIIWCYNSLKWFSKGFYTLTQGTLYPRQKNANLSRLLCRSMPISDYAGTMPEPLQGQVYPLETEHKTNKL